MTDQNVEILVEQLPTHVKQILDQIIESEGFISYGMTTTNKTHTNFLGSLHQVDIKGKTKDGHKEISWFIKLPRPKEAIFFTIEEIFNCESYMYTKLFKIYEELQKNANVPDEERFKAAKVFDGSSPEAIILENLSKKGFKNFPRMEVIPLTFAELSIKKLAKFHALSIVLQNQRPEYFNSKVKPIDNFLCVATERQDVVIKKLFDVSSKHLSEESKNRITISTDTIAEEINKHLTMPNIFKCLCHGDIRNDNLLYREQDFRRGEVIIIDYQMIHYGSPINDFTFLLFVDTDREFRRKHLDHLKNLYYISLEQFLKYFDINLNDLWPREKFEIDYKESLNFGLIHAMVIFPFAFAGENDVPNLENDLVTMDLKPDNRCKDRIQELVDDFIEWRCL